MGAKAAKVYPGLDINPSTMHYAAPVPRATITRTIALGAAAPDALSHDVAIFNALLQKVTHIPPRQPIMVRPSLCWQVGYNLPLILARMCDYESSRVRGVPTIYLTTCQDIERLEKLTASLTPEWVTLCAHWQWWVTLCAA